VVRAHSVNLCLISCHVSCTGRRSVIPLLAADLGSDQGSMEPPAPPAKSHGEDQAPLVPHPNLACDPSHCCTPRTAARRCSSFAPLGGMGEYVHSRCSRSFHASIDHRYSCSAGVDPIALSERTHAIKRGAAHARSETGQLLLRRGCHTRSRSVRRSLGVHSLLCVRLALGGGCGRWRVFGHSLEL